MASSNHGVPISIGGIRGNSPISKYVRSFNNNAAAKLTDEPFLNDDDTPIFSLDTKGLEKFFPSITGPTNNVTNQQNTLVYWIVAIVLIILLWRE